MTEEQFTPRAQRVLRLAQGAAEAMGHSYVGSEHLLLGLLQEEGGAAHRCLSRQHITADRAKSLLIAMVGEGQPGLAPPQGLTRQAGEVIRRAAEEAAAAGKRTVDTEHLLLGMVLTPESAGRRLLEDSGGDPQKIQEDVLQNMSVSVRSIQEPPPPRIIVPREEPVRSRLLEQCTQSLTALARAGKLDPVIGRDREIGRTVRILTRKSKHNPVLIGEPGVGKTAVAEGLAQWIAEGRVPEELRGQAVLSLDLSGLLAGTKYRGEFEERIKNILAEIRKSDKMILFIDELHNLVGAGSAEGAVDAANLLKPALSRGELRVVGATTLEEYRRYIEKDGALERRFQPVYVEEPAPEAAEEILEGLRPRYESHHGVAISDDAIHQAVELGRRYLSGRFLPDKAIDLVDEACSRVRLRPNDHDPQVLELKKRRDEARRDKTAALSRGDRAAAAGFRDAEADFSLQLQQAERKSPSRRGLVITGGDVAAVASEWTGIPLQQLTENESQRLARLEEELQSRVIGQDRAVSAVAAAVRRSRLGLGEENRPQGSFLFLGPTGVGKTELCRVLAQSVFGRRDALIRLDMSEYAEAHSVSRLVGAPPGYVGHEDGGRLTEAVRRRPYSLVLLDELEKAHPDVWNLLLQILEEGCLTDSQGRKVDFRNTLVAMTSNVGAEALSGRLPLGFAGEAGEEAQQRAMERAVDAAVRRTFRPEMLGRVDQIVCFRALSEENLADIGENMLRETEGRLEKAGIILRWGREAPVWLAQHCSGQGARPLRRLIRSRVEDGAARGILSGEYPKGTILSLIVHENDLAIFKETV